MSSATRREEKKTWNKSGGVIAIGGIVRSGPLNFSGFARIQGEFFTDAVAGTLVINYYRAPGQNAADLVYSKSIFVDGNAPATTYSWDEPVRGIYVEIVYTNGGVAATKFLAFNKALPN